MTRKLRGIRWGILLFLSVYVIQGGIASAADQPTDNSQQQVYDLNIGYFDAQASCNASGGTLAGSDNIQKAYNFLVSKGLSNVQAAGILGNLLQESGGNLDPNAGSLTAGTGYGIAQWTTADRQSALVLYAFTNGGKTDDLGTQLGFLWQELSTQYPTVLSSLKSATAADIATNIFEGPDNLSGSPVQPTDEVARSGGYENSGIPAMSNRINYANQVLKLYGNSSTSSGTSPDSSGCTSAINCTPPASSTTTSNPTTGSGSGTSTATSGSSGTPGTVAAGSLSTVRQNVVCLAQQELALWESQPGYPTPAYSQTGYLKYTDNNAEEWCADFVSWIYKQSGDPFTGGSSGGWRIPAVVNIEALGTQGGSFQWHPAGGATSYVPQPGDIAIHIGPGVSHTNIFISSTGGVSTYIGGDQGSGPYPGGSNVSTETVSGYWGDDIIGYVSPD